MKRFINTPFSPSRFPFFYGWIIVAVGTLGVVASVPGQTMGVGVFIDDLMTAHDLKRIDLTRAYMVGTITSSLLLPFAGRLFDRWGARVMVVMASTALAATLVYLSQCDRWAVQIATSLERFSASSVKWLCLTLGFFSLRFWGQGVLTMVSRAMLGKWFNKRRGLASGISSVVSAGAFAIAPSALSSANEALGWRGTWESLAVLIGLGMGLSGWLLYRDNPEECGLLMDGAQPEEDAAIDAPKSAEGNEAEIGEVLTSDFTLLQAASTYAFWVLNYSLGLLGLIYTAMTFHIVALGDDVGLDEGQAVSIFVPMAVISILCNFGGGWLSDRMRIKYLVLILLLSTAIGTAGLLPEAFGHPLGRSLAIFGFGVSGGLFSVLLIVIWPRFYGRKHLGAISGVNMSIMVFASALGPHVFALSEESTGSFNGGILVCVGLSVLGLLAALPVKNPRRPV